MCVTEVWDYRECGCFYNHTVVCRPYQNRSAPGFTPNPEYRVDQWLRWTTANAGQDYSQLAQIAFPIEIQDCPGHRTVQKSFLNQICEDCLLAEISGSPDPCNNSVTTHLLQQQTLDHGEGLIWESEVKIEVESQPQPPPAQSSVPDDIERRETPLREEDVRIFESHVEVTIEPDSRSLSMGKSYSPVFTGSQDSNQSALSASSLETSPSWANFHSATSPNEKPGREKTLDPDDADDEFERTAQGALGKAQPPVRGRSLRRRNLRKAEKEEPVGKIPTCVDNNTAKSAASKFGGFRGLSAVFLSTPKSGAAGDSNGQLLNTACNLAPSRSGSKLLSHSTGRKFSPLLQATHPVSPSEAESEAFGAESQMVSAGLTRKSTLKDIARLLVQDLKRIKASPSTVYRKGESVRNSADVRTALDVSGQKGCVPEFLESAPSSDTVLESDARVTSLLSMQSLTNPTGEDVPRAIAAHIPKSSTMNTLRDAISNMSLRLEHRNAKEPPPVVSETGSKRENHYSADVSDSDHLENGQRQRYPPRSSSLRLGTGIGHLQHTACPK